MHVLMRRTEPGRTATWLGPVLSFVLLVGCGGVLPTASVPGPGVSSAEENKALARFHDRAAQFRQAYEERLRSVGTKLLAAMSLGGPIPFEVLDSNEVNAYNRGGKVYVTLGMLRFVRNDDELALVVGHELGHLVAERRGEAGRLSPENRERTADHHALVGLHRAGYNLVAACELWERMATELAQTPMRWMGSHPSFAERYVRGHKLAEVLRDPDPASYLALPDGARAPAGGVQSFR